MKIIDNPAQQNGLREQGHGAVEFKYALVDHNGRCRTPWFKCKDYINDIFWSYYTGKQMTKYGYTARPADFKVALSGDTFILAVILKKKYDGAEVLDLTDAHVVSIGTMLVQFESALKFRPCQVMLSEDNKHLIITLDKSWSLQPYLINCLVFLLRLGMTHDPALPFIEQYEKAEAKKFTSVNDMGYFLRVKDTLRDLLSGKLDVTQIYNPEDDSTTVHDSYGISSYVRLKKIEQEGRNETTVPAVEII